MANESHERHFLSGKKIIVAGGGVAGLAFVISLRKLWPTLPGSDPLPTVMILERETLEDSLGISRQGYSLSLRSDRPSCGIQSLHKMGILEKMGDVAIHEARDLEGAGFAIWRDDMKTVMRMSPQKDKFLPFGSLRVVRSKMRQVLIDAAGEVQWGRGVKDVKVEENGIAVTTTDGAIEKCDILIAADGGSSKIRSIFRPDDVLIYRGYRCFMASANYGESKPPYPVDRMWGMLPDGKGNAAFLSPVDTHSALWSVTVPHDEKEEVPSSLVGEERAAELLKEAKQYAKTFTPLLAEMQAKTDLGTMRVLKLQDKDPFPHEKGSRLIYIGDANHAVSPYAGNGANLALSDGWDLAESMINAKSLDEAIIEYDKLAIDRSQRVLNMSRYTIKIAHSTGWTHWWYMRLFTVIGVLVWMFRG
jgi:2-polyprenyl-6-methoxyphenol hydroxylase-like FAD-dependent oxidoreductase